MLLPAAFSLLAFTIYAAESPRVILTLDPGFNGAVSQSGLFPTQAMEEQFAAYLRWTKERGIDRLAAFESVIDGGASSGFRFPTQSMDEQFSAYIRWVDDEGLSPFYSFIVAGTRLSPDLDQARALRIAAERKGGGAGVAVPATDTGAP